MRLLEVALATLLWAVTSGEDDCPRGCSCTEGPQTELYCGGVVFQGKRGEYVNVECEEGRNASCALISWYSPRQLALTSCPPLDPSCPPVEWLTLKYPRGIEEQLRGVRGEELRTLTVRGDRANRALVSVPPSLFSLNLTDLRLNSVVVSLPPPPTAPAALRSLEVSEAGLRALPPGLMAGLPRLQALRLWRNNFTEIPDQIFTDAPALVNLSLSVNRLVSASCPRTASPLRNLELFANPLRQVGPFSGCQHLAKIVIIDTHQNTTLSPLTFAHLPELTSITLRNANLRALPPDMFLNTSSLQQLYLNNNKLKLLPKGVFRDCKSLRQLDLSVNLIDMLDGDVFDGLYLLEELNLSNNSLTVLPDNLLSSASSLVHFSASSNMLSTLSVRLFRHNTKLRTLDLRYNRLKEEVPGYHNLEAVSPFNTLMSLERLLLSHNQYSSLYEDFGRILLRLTELRMDYNNIRELDDYSGELSFLQDNVTVNLTHNLIQTVRLSATHLPDQRHVASNILIQDNPFHCDCTLYTLLAAHLGVLSTQVAPAFHLGDAMCATPRNYQGILLKDIKLMDLTCDLPSEVCADNCDCVERPYNVSLEITCSDIPASIPETGGYGVRLRLNRTVNAIYNLTPEVTKLDLSGLNLTEVPKGNYTFLKELNLSNNNLEYISTELFRYNISLFLSGNPISCQCGDADKVNEIIENSGKVADYASVSCGGGGGGVVWAVRGGAGALCGGRRAVVGGAVLAAGGLLLAGAAVLLYRYQGYMRALLFARGWCLCLSEEELDKNKQYDAFVSYSNEDRDFVTTKLLPGLESGLKPFKICVHERDWIAGEWIPAQIVRSVEQSRRTIIVLSNNFLNSLWSQLEFRAAYLSSQKENRSRLIVILLEDVSIKQEIDAELKAYLATNTYLKWGDPFFWERLRYALPHRTEETVIRHDGKKLMKKVLQPNQPMLGGLQTKLTPEGLLINAAKDKDAPPPAFLPNCHSLTDLKDPAIMAANCQNMIVNVNEKQKL